MFASVSLEKESLITIISVNYNSSDFFRVSLKALERLTRNPWKLVICDNGSEPQDLARLRNLISPYKNITLVTRAQSTPGSMGHGEALNLLKEHIDTPYGVALDPDCIPLMCDWDQFLIERLDSGAKISGTPLATNTPGSNVKPKDFPLIFLCLFEAETFMKLGIDFRPQNISAGQDTGWELRDKYLKAGFRGYNLHGQNTRTFSEGSFAETICDEYYTDEQRTQLICCHLGRGSNPRSGKYTKGKLFRLWHRRYYETDKKRWLKICENIIDQEIGKLARRRERGLEYVSCVLCGADETEKLFASVDRLNHMPGQWNLVLCKRCGLVYTNPRPDKTHLFKFYPDSYGPYQDAEEEKVLASAPGKESHSVKESINRQLMRQHFNYFRREIAPSIAWRLLTWPLKHRKNIALLPKWPGKGEGSVLEIGCSHGARLMALRELGWETQGIELSEVASKKAREKGLTIETGEIESIDFKSGSFDVIIMSMVLEHVFDPSKVICRVTQWLKPGGELLLSVPDFNGLESKWFKTYHYGIQVPTHLTHFTQETVRKILNGFQCSITHQYFHRDLKAGLELYLQDNPNSVLKYLPRFPKKVYTLTAFVFALIGKSSRMSVRARKLEPE